MTTRNGTLACGLMNQQSWQLDGPLDLRRSLRFTLPKATSSARLGGQSSHYALATATGPATVTVWVADRRLIARAEGPGADMATSHVPRSVGLDDDPAAFEPAVGPLRELHRRYRGLRLGSTGRVFDTLLPTIIGQRVTTDEAGKSYRRLSAALGSPAPGDLGLVIPPPAETIANMRYEELHPLGIERSRAQIVIEAARRAARLEEIVDMNRSDAARRLAAVRGIGPWTIGQVMGSAWGDRDAVPRGDFHLPHTVAWLLTGEPRATDERMQELLEPYRPFRRRALILAKLSGVHAPRYGPRSPKSVISGS